MNETQDIQTPPPNAEAPSDMQALQEAPTPDPYDSTPEQEELQALTLELQQTSASLEGDFAKMMSETMSPEMEDLFFEDKEAFFKEVLKAQNNYWNERVTSKTNRANELAESINRKSYEKGMAQQRADFEREAGVDVNEVLQFMEDYVPNKIKAQLEQLPPKEMYQRVYMMMQETGGMPQVEASPTPPMRIEGNPAPSGHLSYERDLLPTQRW